MQLLKLLKKMIILQQKLDHLLPTDFLFVYDNRYFDILFLALYINKAFAKEQIQNPKHIIIIICGNLNSLRKNIGIEADQYVGRLLL